MNQIALPNQRFNPPSNASASSSSSKRPFQSSGSGLGPEEKHEEEEELREVAAQNQVKGVPDRALVGVPEITAVQGLVPTLQ